MQVWSCVVNLMLVAKHCIGIPKDQTGELVCRNTSDKWLAYMFSKIPFPVTDDDVICITVV